ncbi:MAG: hypothetical protein HOP15_11485 [Planctomycetes bacterium]|nr:hypothetical protein [Planctomycetota bacterium]
MHRFALALLALASLASSAGAQGKGVLGHENAEFARRLFEQGYVDLAQGLCLVIEANNASPSELLEVKALGFELRVKQALGEKDLVKRKGALRSVLDEEILFIKENARTRVADAVRANLPSVYLELSTALTAAVSKEQDPVRRAELTQESQELFEGGEQNLEKRVEDFAKRLADAGGDTDYNRRQHEVALFNLAKMNYQHSLLFAQGAPEQKELLEKALEGFQDFGFDYSESPHNYRGMIYQGLCHEALGMTEDALTDYRDALALREEYVLDEKGVYQVGPEEGDIISGATHNLMKLLTRLGRARQAVAAAVDYLQHTPDPLLANSGPEILKAKAEAEIVVGDIASASATAQTLIDLDPLGWAGSKGRELLARLPVDRMAPDKILKIAETSAGRGDYKRAVDLCRQAREAGRGARDEHDTGAASFLLTGFVYQRQARTQEASLAFDCAAELYPRGKSAPEALYAAVNAYRELSKRERQRFYSKRAEERMDTLAKKYPEHPRAASAGIFRGLQSEDEGDFERARDYYSKIPKDSGSYVEAQFRLATATNLQAKSLAAQGKRAEAQPLFDAAEKQYGSAMELIAAAQESTLDTAVQKRLATFLVQCRTGLASLYLDTEKPGKVQELLAGLEQKVDDPEVVANIWDLRITALQAQGKLDEAVALFESIILASPGTTGVSSAAGVLARALDLSAQDLFTKDSQSKKAGELWRKAGHYYSLSVKGALAGTASLRPTEVASIAQRLYVIGLFFNGVPEFQSTFVDWQGTVAAPDLWEEAAAIYERLDAQAPSYRVSVERARTLAILGRISEAETIYARLFDQNSLFVSGDTTRRFDRAVIEARPELVPAFLEWGVATHMVGIQTKDEGRLDRAKDIYERMILNYDDSSRPWWQAKYFQFRLLSDRGLYDQADLGIQSLKRNTDPEYDQGRFGFKDKFKALEAELSKKVFK